MTVFAVEVSQLAEVVWVSALAGFGITTTYSVAVLGAGRYLLVFVGGLIWGVAIMLAK